MSSGPLTTFLDGARDAELADIHSASDGYARRFAGRAGAWLLHVQERGTLRLLADYPGASVLDVGGGHGQIAGPLAAAGHRVTVLGSAAVCEHRVHDLVAAGKARFDVGSVVDLPYPDRSFDVVTSFRLLSHVHRWEQLVSELARVARQAVIVDYPVEASVNRLTPYLFSLKKRAEGNTRTYRCFTDGELARAFAASGLRRDGRYAQFFLPMVVHRQLQAPALSALLERGPRALGLTDRVGSPVIARFVRQTE
jgi:2-polyprenyl-3-methyl-5-hydroxy-6-metoxy-1,4-benzoquinol methylase